MRLREVQAVRLYGRDAAALAGERADEAVHIAIQLGREPARERDVPGVPGVRQAARPVLVLGEGDDFQSLTVTRHGARPRPAFQSSAEPVTVATGLPEFIPSAKAWMDKAGERVGPALEAVLTTGSAQDRVAVELACSSTWFAAQPWELVPLGGVPLVNHRRVSVVSRYPADRKQHWYFVRLLQRVFDALGIPAGMPDGIAGPRFAEALVEFRRNHGLSREPVADAALAVAIGDALRARTETERRPLRVLVLQPAIGGSLYMARGLSDRSDQLVGAYHAAFQTQSGRLAPKLSLRVRSGGEIAELVSRLATPRASTSDAAPGDRADVVHVCTVMESTARMPVLGLDARKGPPMSAAMLDVLVRGLGGPVPPLVVLDVQAPPSPVDAARQLLMRNQFAYQLMALGNVDTVIATGFETGRHTAQWRCLTQGIAAGGNAVTICNQIQSLAAPAARTRVLSGDERLIAYQGTALFCGLPAEVVLTPGLVSTPN
jgi:hypothetical protein